MNKLYATLLLALTCALPALAQTATSDSLYQALGAQAGITRLVDDFVERAVRDPRIREHFKDTRPQGLKDSLVEQFCHLSGGPCVYKGADMKAAHADIGLRKVDFLALVEVLQTAMDAQSLPFAQQNRLLALLAPMHRDIITER